MKYALYEITNAKRDRISPEPLFETDNREEMIEVWTVLDSYRQHGVAIKRDDGRIDFGEGYIQHVCEACGGTEAVAQGEYTVTSEPEVQHCSWLCAECREALGEEHEN